MDVAAVAVGRDFRKAIDESVATCGVLLALIGPGWLDAKNERDELRLYDPGDFVRMETASALRREIPVIPVLVRGAKMPRPNQLPDDLKELAYRNCVELTHVRWKSDVKVLVRALRSLLGDPRDIVPGKRTYPSEIYSQSELKSQLRVRHPPAGEAAEADAANRSQTVPVPSGAVAEARIAAQPTSSQLGSPPTEKVPVASPTVDSPCGGSVDLETIARITRELAQYIGPIAEVVVKRAAKRITTVSELRHMVAQEIEASADRTRFLDACRGS